MHFARAYKSKGRCNTCSRSHHLLLHRAYDSSARDQETSGPTTNDEISWLSTTSIRPTTRLTRIPLEKRKPELATSQIHLLGPQNAKHTEDTVQELNLPRRRVVIAISGVGAVSLGTAQWTTQLLIRSIHDPATLIPDPWGHCFARPDYVALHELIGNWNGPPIRVKTSWS